jgi:hypothetical protein
VSDQRSRSSRDRGRRSISARSSDGRNHNGSSISGRNERRHIGLGGNNGGSRRWDSDCSGRRNFLDNLRARNSVVLVVNTSAKFDCRTIGDTDVVAGAGIVNAAHAGATRTVVLCMDASAKFDSRSAGNADIVASASVELVITGSRSGISVISAENGETIQLRRGEHRSRANGQKEAQGGRKSEGSGRHCFGCEVKAKELEVKVIVVLKRSSECLGSWLQELDMGRKNDCSRLC